MSSRTAPIPTLHILNKAPNHPRFEACLAAQDEGDLLLLTENAVLALSDRRIQLPSSIRALASDCQARGISGEGRLVDYTGMVELTDRFSRIISW